MRNILYLVAAILLVSWLIAVIGYSAGGLVHVLLILAVVSILVERTGRRRKEFNNGAKTVNRLFKSR